LNIRSRPGELAVFELEMTGLSCQACANKVKLQIERQEGVVGCDMFLEDMRAVVPARPCTFNNEAQLEALVVAAGSKYRGKVVKQYSLSRGGSSEDEETNRVKPK
jgi:copper chaperone CopZ